MDSAATNYNADATEDDGSCEYPVACDASEVTVTLMDSYGDGGGSVTVGDMTLTNDGSMSSMVVCVDLTTCIDVTYASTDSWSYENSWSVTDADGNDLASGTSVSGDFGTCAPPVIPGCMD